MCMLDATKAFHNVDFAKLFELLMRSDIPGVFLRLILYLYTHQTLKTAWDGAIDLPYSVTNGVRQGGVLSPILLNVYFDELLQRLQDHDIGFHVGTKFVGAFGYADEGYIYLEGEKIKWVNSARHLGNLIPWNLKAWTFLWVCKQHMCQI